MLPTPSTTHISPTQIYEPSEDSYLLLDALSSSSETSFLTTRFANAPTPLLCEIGTGSGIVLAFLAAHSRTILGRADVLALGTDVNPFACVAASETVRGACAEHKSAAQSGLLDAVQGDLATAVAPRSVDVLVFNPPYVPSDSVPARPGDGARTATGEEARQRDFALLALATDGGAEGMEITERLLRQIPDVLSARGVAYVLLCKRNKPERVRERVRGWGGGAWSADIVRDSGRMGGIESLCVLRIARRLVSGDS